MRMIGNPLANLSDIAHDANIKWTQNALGECADCHACRCFTRARTLKDIAHIFVIVFQDTREVSMAWSRTCDRYIFVPIPRKRGHTFLPISPVFILDDESDG